MQLNQFQIQQMIQKKSQMPKQNHSQNQADALKALFEGDAQ